MRSFHHLLLLPIMLSTLAAAGPLPLPLSDTLSTRAPISTESSPGEVHLQPRTVTDATNENLAVLTERDIESWWFKVKCASNIAFNGDCNCPGVWC